MISKREEQSRTYLLGGLHEHLKSNILCDWAAVLLLVFG